MLACAQMMLLMRSMYIELGLVTTFFLDMNMLDAWLCAIYRNYNVVPFHNFSHCFCVTQMTYAMIWGLNLTTLLEEIDLLTLLVSATCHDMDHPGFNNAFQVSCCIVDVTSQHIRVVCAREVMTWMDGWLPDVTTRNLRTL